MANEEIIADVAVSNGIFSSEEIEEMFEAGEEIPLHTVQGWNARLGRCLVKKGEHGIETKLWKKKKKEGEADTKDEEEPLKREFYLAKSYLFTRNQMIVIEE